jgi:serine/threonine protein kinase
MTTTTRSCHVISQWGSYVLELSNGRRVFVKAWHSDKKSAQAIVKERTERERICLEVLRGLAVPRWIKLPRRLLPSWCRGAAVYLAESYEGVTIHNTKLTDDESLGAWLFVLEQMAAFRRCQILYTDLKCANLLLQRDPMRVMVVDFGAAGFFERTRFIKHFGYTLDYVAPEANRGVCGTERSLVYTAGILLPHFITGMNNGLIDSPERGLEAAARRLDAMGAREARKAMLACMEPEPHKRPATYLELWRRLRRAEVPEGARSVWAGLRRPYALRLGELKM